VLLSPSLFEFHKHSNSFNNIKNDGGFLMGNRFVFLILFLIFIHFSAFADVSSDPYVFITSDTAKLAYVQQICTNFGHSSLKEINGKGFVLGPFSHGAMAYENCQIFKKEFPGAKVIRLDLSEERMNFVSPTIREKSHFPISATLGNDKSPTNASPVFSDYYDNIKILRENADFLNQIQSMSLSLQDSDGRKGMLLKFMADKHYRNSFADLKSGNASFSDSKDLYKKIIRGEVSAPREMKGHSAIKLIFIEQAENNTEVWCPGFQTSDPDAYIKVYQEARDAYEFLDDERYKPEAAVHTAAKLLELAIHFDICTFQELRDEILTLKSDLPSSDSIRSIEQPILSNMDYIVRKYRYNVSTLDLMFAETYYFEQEYEKARQHFEEIVNLYPDVTRSYTSALQWQGLNAFFLEKYEEASDCFTTLLKNKVHPDNENSFAKRNPFSNSALWLGQIYMKQNKKDETVSLYKWVLDTYPDCSEKEYINKCLKSLQE
jgi:tetratricopeptide (TPR) repeat protein